jgi:hypothetical protein
MHLIEWKVNDMSLTYDYSAVRDSDTLMFDEDDRMKPESECIIFATIFIGINTITEANWQSFYLRLSMYENAHGSLVRRVNDDGLLVDSFMSPEIVRAHIGLHTNARNLTMPQFKKRIVERLEEEAKRSLHSYNETEVWI